MKWREIGDVSLDTWKNTLIRYRSPILDEADRAYATAQPHSALCLAQLIWESRCGTEGIATSGGHNPLGLRPRDGGTDFERFSTWNGAIKFWKLKILDPSYAYRDTVTVKDYIHVYAPSWDGNDEAAYVAHVEKFAKEHAIMGEDIVHGRVPRPAMKVMIVPKPYDGAGFNRVPARSIVGTCHHRTDGKDTPQSTYNLFATGGERQYDALTDFVIGFDGEIWMLNDPWGTRAGWANGGSDGLEGDGPLFVRTFGVAGINNRLASIEHCGRAELDPLTEAQIASTIKLTAWIHDQAKQDWSAFPLHQAYGCVTQMQHFEFATKPCPGSLFRKHTNRIQDGVRALMKAHQTQAQPAPSPSPVPPPKPTHPDHSKIPAGMTLEKLEQHFGFITRRQKGRKDAKLGFNIDGVISNAWMERGSRTNHYPAADDLYVLANGMQIATFDNGWLLIKKTERSGWEWAN